MLSSIRTFLLANLLVGVILITSITTITNIYFTRNTIYRRLDNELSSAAFIVQQAITSSMHPNEAFAFNSRQRLLKTRKIMRSFKCIQTGSCTFHVPHFFKRLQFYILDNKQHRVLYSDVKSFKIGDNKRSGFQNIFSNSKRLRIFILKNKKSPVTVVAIESFIFRYHLETQLAQNSLLIMLLSLPILILLIWLTSGKALGSISKIADEVKHRAASSLHAVDTKAIPSEVQPLINELNMLFIRMQSTFQREKRFAADAAHELRTPLAALRAQAQIALTTPQEEDRTEALRKVLQGVDRSTHTVQQLLTLSRMVPERSIQDPKPVALNKEAARVIADLVPAALKKHIDIELVAPDEDQIILGDAIAIDILIRNLVDNAIRYTTESGQVKVVITPKQQYIVFKVIDSGPGIPENMRKRVFDRFFRIVGNDIPGSGLGLGIVKQIVQLHNAKIGLYTPKSGEGLEVRVLFRKSEV